MLKADFHLHTYYSRDCNMSPRTIVETCIRRGVSCIAVTDHNRFAAVKELQRIAPFLVIPAEEINSTQGEIIGLFLREEVPRGMDPGKTAEAIRSQGGVVYVPHPFDRIRKGRLRLEAMKEILELIDVIEIYNSRITFMGDVRKASSFAQEHGKLLGAGSDAHVWWELGHSYVEMPEFQGREGFLESLRQGKVGGRLTHPAAHVASTLIKWRGKYLKRWAPRIPS